MPRGDDDALEAIRQGLVSRAEDVALDLLGEPAYRNSVEWRWGRKRALAMVIRGPKRGLWSDHADGDEGGDLLDLIQRERSGGFPAALDYARALLRLPVDYTPPPRPTVTGAPKLDTSDAARIAFARRLWSEAGEVRGTVAERYLTETRRIPTPATGWPECVRYHPGRGALIVAATTAAGEVQAVQLVHLTAEATKQPGTEKRPTKQSYGPQAGSTVRLPACQVPFQVTFQVTAGGAPLLLAEGPENGLSTWAATGRETWIALGGVGKIRPTPGRRLVVCADDDPPDKSGAKGRRKAVSRWRAEGFAVVLAHPWARRRRDKSDFNDVLHDHGLEAVRARIDAALSDPAHGGVQAVPVEQARTVLQKAVADFIVAARDFVSDDPDRGCVAAVYAIRGGVGTGKSDAALRHLARELQAMRERGDARNVAVAVPRHLLAEEQAERFRELPEAAGLTAAGWRGREALDPQAPGYLDKAIPDERKTKMCRDLPAVRDAQSLSLPVEENVCHRRKGGEEFVCPFHGECGAQRQKGQRADVWFVPHESLFGRKPAALGELFAVVVDEAAWQDGLEGLESHSLTLALDALHGDAVVPDDFQGRDTQRLREVHRLVLEALRDQPNGPLRRDAMLAAGVTAETATDGRILTWARKVDPGFRPGMTAAQRREAMTAAKDNPIVMRLARFFGALEALLAEGGPEASGWIALETQDSDHGPVRVLRLRGRRNVGTGWRVPTLLIDALLNPALVRPYWPQVVVTAEVEATTPHMRVRQAVGRDWSKSRLVPGDYASPAEVARLEHESRKLLAIVLREARWMFDGRKVLVVAPKAVEEAWRAASPLPSWLLLAHHNGVAGSDDYKHVAGVIVAGRIQATPGGAERMAEALTGAAVAERVAGFQYPREDAPILLRDGRAETGEADCHPDPVTEAIRWQICEGELVQIIGRGRGVNRTAADPLQVLLLTDRPLPLAVDELIPVDALEPSPADLMLAMGGVVLADAADAARAYSELWPNRDRTAGSPEAAKKAFQRAAARCGTIPFRESPKGDCPAPLLIVAYQRAGAGRRPTSATYDPAVVPDPQGWLVEKLGPLAPFKVASPEPPAAVLPAVAATAALAAALQDLLPGAPASVPSIPFPVGRVPDRVEAFFWGAAAWGLFNVSAATTQPRPP